MFPPNTHILLVDDMKGVRLLITKLLKDMGYSLISQAGDGKEAHQIVVNSQTTENPVGLIICDLRMPELDGIGLLKLVRDNPATKDLPFILLTAEAEKDSVVDAVKANVSDYMVKPVSNVILTKKLAMVWGMHHGK